MKNIVKKYLESFKRQRIYKEIDEEREYQDNKWGTENDNKNTPNDWIAYITAYNGKAYRYPSDKDNFRKCMIKVAALAIAAIEACDRNNGFPPNSLD